MAEPKLITSGVIASRLGVPLHRVVRVLNTRGIRASARAGPYWLYCEADVEAVRQVFAEIDARKRSRRTDGRVP